MPLGFVTRTVRVRGGTSTSIDYVEAGPVLVPSRVILTTNYSSTEPGGANRARIVSSGSCASITGGVSESSCAVGLSHGATLERFTVTTTTAFGTSAIVTASGTDTNLGAPVLVDVVASGASSHGLRTFGSVSIGPRVSATRNGGSGLKATCLGSGFHTVSVSEPSPLPTAPTSFFDENTLNGIEVAGASCSVGLRGVQASTNRGHGLSLALAPVSLSGTYPTHVLGNVRATGNFNAGLSLTGGRVNLVARAGVINHFDGNGVQPSGGDIGYGIRMISSVADFAQLTTDQLGTMAQPLIAHTANGNSHGGVLLAMATGVLGTTHELRSLEVSGNGAGGSALVDGVTVRVGAAQPSLRVRWSSFTGNGGANLRFAQGTTNTLDIGTPSAPGQNIFFAPTSAQRASLCVENRTTTSRTQTVDVNRWSPATTCLPFAPNQIVTASCSSSATPFDFVVVQSADAGVTFTASSGCY